MSQEVIKPDATQLAMNREEIDMQIVTAHRFPRNEVKAVEKSKMLAVYSHKTAQACIYFRPVGKKDGIQQFASGPSIRLAEIMKGKWGNLRVAKSFIGLRDGQVGVKWGIHDLESNVMEQGEVWKSYHGSEKMIPVITAAAMKFAERDAVFSIVPKAYAEEIMDECRKAVVGEGEDKQMMYNAVVESFKEMGVTENMLFSVIDRKEYPQGSDEELVFMIGLHNAIKDGLCTIEDCFGKKPTKPENLKRTTPKKTEPKTQEKKQSPTQDHVETVFNPVKGIKHAAKKAGIANLDGWLQAEFSIGVDDLPNNPDYHDSILKTINEMPR